MAPYWSRESASLSDDMSSWTTGTIPAVVALCRMLMVSMKSGNAAKNLPTLSKAELSPNNFYKVNIFLSDKIFFADLHVHDHQGPLSPDAPGLHYESESGGMPGLEVVLRKYIFNISKKCAWYRNTLWSIA